MHFSVQFSVFGEVQHFVAWGFPLLDLRWRLVLAEERRAFLIQDIVALQERCIVTGIGLSHHSRGRVPDHLTHRKNTFVNAENIVT